MATTTIANNTPFTAADKRQINAWGQGHLTDKECAQAQGIHPDTAKRRRERIANMSGLFTGKVDAGHLLIHLIDKQWVKVAAALLLLVAGPVQDITQQISDDMLRTSRNTRAPRRGSQNGSRRNRRREDWIDLGDIELRTA